ncbi:MAG: hypothetical protein JO100_19000 [Pseudonocardia sp.]|nr:hypothetical protein [Pseudonocardia sp.]
MARRGTGLIISLLRFIGLIIVAILVVHILLTVFKANPANRFALFMHRGADFFSLGLTNLFTPTDPRVAVAVNYGIAALIWLLITSVVVGIIRRIG